MTDHVFGRVPRRNLCILQLPPDFPPRVVCLAWHRERYRSPAAVAFAEAAQRWCERYVAEDLPTSAALASSH